MAGNGDGMAIHEGQFLKDVHAAMEPPSPRGESAEGQPGVDQVETGIAIRVIEIGDDFHPAELGEEETAAEDLAEDVLGCKAVTAVAVQDNGKRPFAVGTDEIEPEVKGGFIGMKNPVLGERGVVERTDDVGMKGFKPDAAGGRGKTAVFEWNNEIEELLAAAFPVGVGFNPRAVTETEGVGQLRCVHGVSQGGRHWRRAHVPGPVEPSRANEIFFMDVTCPAGIASHAHVAMIEVQNDFGSGREFPDMVGGHQVVGGEVERVEMEEGIAFESKAAPIRIGEGNPADVLPPSAIAGADVAGFEEGGNGGAVASDPGGGLTVGVIFERASAIPFDVFECWREDEFDAHSCERRQRGIGLKLDGHIDGAVGSDTVAMVGMEPGFGAEGLQFGFDPHFNPGVGACNGDVGDAAAEGFMESGRLPIGGVGDFAAEQEIVIGWGPADVVEGAGSKAFHAVHGVAGQQSVLAIEADGHAAGRDVNEAAILFFDMEGATGWRQPARQPAGQHELVPSDFMAAGGPCLVSGEADHDAQGVFGTVAKGSFRPGDVEEECFLRWNGRKR